MPRPGVRAIWAPLLSASVSERWISRTRPSLVQVTFATSNPTSSERRRAPVKPIRHRARSRRRRASAPCTDELADLGRGERRCVAGLADMLASYAAKSFTDGRVLGVERVAGDAAGVSDRGDPAAKGRERVAFIGRGQVGADHLGRCWHCDKAVLAAPGGEVCEVSSVGAQCRGSVSRVLVGL